MPGPWDYNRYRTLFLLFTVGIFLWGLMGTLDLRNIPSDGYYFGPDYVVTQVLEGGPAGEAGIRIGDLVTKIDGTRVEDLTLAANRRRPTIDSVGSVTIKRGEIEKTLTFKYAPLSEVDLIASFGSVILTGLLFLILGPLVYFQKPTRLSTAFCGISLLFALVLLPRPNFSLPIPRRLSAGVLTFLTAAAFAALLDYCLHFPHARKILAERAWLRQLLYLPAIVFGVMTATIEITTPPMTPLRSMLMTIANGSFYGLYILLSLVVVVHGYLAVRAQEREAAGLGAMVLGMIVGLGPLLVSLLAHAFNPHMGFLPGERFHSITLFAIPMALAIALRKLQTTQS